MTPPMHAPLGLTPAMLPLSPRERDLAEAGFSMAELRARVSEAQDFHARFLATTRMDAHGLSVEKASEWRAKFIRRHGGIAPAVLAKLGSNLLAKRRPQDGSGFQDYVTQCFAAQHPLQLRLVFGPVKNVPRYGANQAADMAEYLTLIQLARTVEALATIYPHGVRVQLVPDDRRGGIANRWPAAYSQAYIRSLQRLVRQLQFDDWLMVEDGQARLYAQYGVDAYLPQAMQDVLADAEFTAKLARATLHARENLFAEDGMAAPSAIEDSALRYLVAHRAEVLSGLWSPTDALPLMYANHPGNYQLFTLGRGLTKLPWQVRLPFAVLAAAGTDVLTADLLSA